MIFERVAKLVAGEGKSRFLTNTNGESWDLTQQSASATDETLTPESDIDFDDRAFFATAPRMLVPRTLPRHRMDRRPHGFLKISDGCNHTCTFCSIPLMKGVYSSVPRQVLLDETRRMLDDGVREINIVAQDITKYGLDIEKRMMLPELLNNLASIEGEFWIRLFYLYPSTVTKDLIAVMKAQPKIARYLDVPLQHLHEDVLRRMKRPHDRARTMEMLRSLRSRTAGRDASHDVHRGIPRRIERRVPDAAGRNEEIRFEPAWRVHVFARRRNAGGEAAESTPGKNETSPQRKTHEAPGADQRRVGTGANRQRAHLPDRRPRARQRLVRCAQRERGG